MSSWSSSGGGGRGYSSGADKYSSGADKYSSSSYGGSSGGGYSGGGGGSGGGSGYPAPSSGGGSGYGAPSGSSRAAPPPAPTSRNPKPSSGGGGGGGGSGSGSDPAISVSGCGNPTVSNIIKGPYVVNSANHGKPVYKKEGSSGSVSVLMYYWDERDGPSFSGWWFGPKVGGDQVWAYNGDTAAPLPPTSGWKVPWDGPVDNSLKLSIGGDSGSTRGGASAPGGREAHPSSRHSSQPSNSRDDDMARRAADDARRREESRKQAADDQKRRDEQRKREVEDGKRREEEQRRRREKEKEEEDRRRKADEKRRKEEEERRRESNAALAIRKVIQKVRVATPETYDKLRSELEDVKERNLAELGSQAEKVSAEIEQTLQAAQKRIDEIQAKREADEVKRVEDEKRRKEQQDLVDKLVKEMTDEVKEAEDKVLEAQETVKVAMEGEATAKPDEMVVVAESTEKTIETIRTFFQKTSHSLVKKQDEMGDNDAARKVKREVGELHGKVASGRRSLDKLVSSLNSSKERAQRKAIAMKRDDARNQNFVSADADKDGKLDRKEVVAFSKAAHSFDLPEQVLDKIMKSLEPIKIENFHNLHLKVALAKNESQARTKRAEEAEKQRIIEEKRQAIQKVVDEASAILDTAEATVASAEDKAKPLTSTRDAGLNATQTKELAGESEALVKKAEEELKDAITKLEQVETDTAAVPELVGTFDRKEAPRLRQRHGQSKQKTEKVLAAVKEAYEKAEQKAYAELDALVVESVKAIRNFMTAEAKNSEQLLAHIDSGAEALKQDKYVEFLKGLTDFKLEDGQAEKIFKHIAGEAGEISKQQFLELIRFYYKCVKATVLSEELSIKSKTLRRLDLGEALELLEGPATEEGANVKRVKCLCVTDDATGWVTIAGNQGTPFLLPGGNIYVCVKDTVLSDGLSVTESKTVRRITKGETIEVLEFPKKDAALDIKRIRGKAKLDGATGWISVCGNQGTAFLECQ